LEEIKEKTIYKVSDSFFIKKNNDESLIISYYGHSVILNIREFFIGVVENYYKNTVKNFYDYVDKGVDNLTNDKNLPKNIFLDLSVESLNLILNKLEKEENFEMCEKIKKIIDIKNNVH
jgi:hypothetical protein